MVNASVTNYLSPLSAHTRSTTHLISRDSFTMNTQEKVFPSGQHYSGHNRVPNIKQFMESLDQDKRDREAKAESDPQANRPAGEVPDHKQVPKKVGKNRRTVRDPVTGNVVEIDDFDRSYVKSAKHPHVIWNPPPPPAP